MSELARIAGTVGCLGLALLLLAPRRELRLAGLGGVGVRDRRTGALSRAGGQNRIAA